MYISSSMYDDIVLIILYWMFFLYTHLSRRKNKSGIESEEMLFKM